MKRNYWVLAVIVWVLLIFFSSTTLAGEWAENIFATLSLPFLMSSQSNGLSLEWPHFVAEKSVHVTLFFVLALLLWRAIPSISHKVWLVLFCGALIGSMSEILQGFFPKRDPALRDVCINTAATAIGLIAQLRIEKNAVERKSPQH